MLNSAIITGRFVRDPELRTTASGVAVTSFTLAVERDRAESDGNRAADFIDCVAWRQLAEFVCRYFTKGQMATVSGRLQRRSYEDKSGAKRSTVEVIAGEVYFAGRMVEPPVTAADFAELGDVDLDLPF